MSAIIGNEAEQVLAFQCRADRLPPFVQNFRPIPNRKFELDIAFPSLKVGVECNGGVFTRGAHGSPLAILRDMEKSNELVFHGWRVLRYTPAQIKTGVAIDGLKQLLGSVL